MFYLDYRSLAFFRIFLGITLIFDFFDRFHLVDAFYTDGGILSRSDLISKYEISWKMGLLNLNGSPLFANLLIVIGIVASLFYTLGVRTKFSAFISWILLMSFQNRFPEANHGGDNLLRILLMISLFLPIQFKYSFDKAFSELPEVDKKYYGLSSVFPFVQIFLVYLFTFAYKWHPSWLTELDSVYLAMSLDILTTDLARVLLGFPLIMKIMSFMTLWIEGLGPFLLIITWRQDLMRMIAIFLFLSLHFGILLTIELGNFPWACFALWLIILPTTFWDFINEKIISKRSKVEGTLYYDKDCGFCRKFCLFLKDIFFLQDLKVAASSSDKAADKIIQKEASWTYSINGKFQLRYDVFCELLKSSPFKFIGFVFDNSIARSFGDFSYRILSKQRMKLGVLINRYLREEARPNGILKNTFMLGLILLSIAWNFEGILGSKKFDVKTPFTEMAFLFGLNQQWNMFAPKPMRNDGWPVIDGVLRDGTRIDPFFNREVHFLKPRDVRATVDGTRWRKFFMNLVDSENSSYRLLFGKYVCRTWNREHDNKLEEFKIYFMIEQTPYDANEPLEVRKNLLWNHYCFKN